MNASRKIMRTNVKLPSIHTVFKEIIKKRNYSFRFLINIYDRYNKLIDCSEQKKKIYNHVDTFEE